MVNVRPENAYEGWQVATDVVEGAVERTGLPVNRDIATRAAAALAFQLDTRAHASDLKRISSPPGWNEGHTNKHAVKMYYLGMAAKEKGIEPDPVLDAYAKAIVSGKFPAFEDKISDFEQQSFTGTNGQSLNGLALTLVANEAEDKADNRVQVNRAVAELIKNRNASALG